MKAKKPCKKNRKPRVYTHKFSRTALLNWAKRQVAANPTYTESSWDFETRQHVTLDYTNTPARELALLLQANFCRQIADYKRSELWDTLTEMVWNGTDAYRSYTIDRALDELMEVHAEECEYNDEDEDRLSTVEDFVSLMING